MTNAEKLELLLDYHVNLDLIYVFQRTNIDEDELYEVYCDLASDHWCLMSKDEFLTVYEMLKKQKRRLKR